MTQAAHQETFTETARRAQIVGSAIDTVNEIGYPRASLAEIAKRAGVAKSAIVYYFGSKDALLLHAVGQVFEALGTAIETAVAAETAAEARLRAYAVSYLAHIDAHRREVAAAVAILVSHRDADGTPLYLTSSEEDTALLRSILSDGMDAGAFRTMPLPAAVSIVEALLDIAITAVQMDLQADLAERTDEIVDFLFRGLA